MIKSKYFYKCDICDNSTERGFVIEPGADPPKPSPPLGWNVINGKLICEKHAVKLIVDGKEVL
jgi:hypothetical protein